MKACNNLKETASCPPAQKEQNHWTCKSHCGLSGKMPWFFQSFNFTPLAAECPLSSTVLWHGITAWWASTSTGVCMGKRMGPVGRKPQWATSEKTFTDQVKILLYIWQMFLRLIVSLCQHKNMDPVLFTLIQNPSTCRIQDHLHYEIQLQNWDSRT